MDLRNKGPQDYSALTINGRVRVTRIRWHGPGVGSRTVIDAYLDSAERTISVGVREMACRLNGGGTNFDRTAENLAASAQVRASGETLRTLIEDEGRQVLQAFRSGSSPTTWTAADCRAEPSNAGSPARVYFGCDGVMAPMVTADEKTKRREKVKAERQRRGRRCRPLRRVRRGADQRYKEFKIVTYYDEPKAHRLVLGTRGNNVEAGRLMRRLAGRIDLSAAAEKVGNGRVWQHATYVAIGVNLRGREEPLGLWPSGAEGAEFCLSCLTGLKSRGVSDIFVACADGLSGFPEAIRAALPQTKAQLGIVHLVRAASRAAVRPCSNPKTVVSAV